MKRYSLKIVFTFYETNSKSLVILPLILLLVVTTISLSCCSSKSLFSWVIPRSFIGELMSNFSCLKSFLTSFFSCSEKKLIHISHLNTNRNSKINIQKVGIFISMFILIYLKFIRIPYAYFSDRKRNHAIKCNHFWFIRVMKIITWREGLMRPRLQQFWIF